MAHGLVNRQPQVRRVQDQRFLPHRRRLGLVHRHRFFRGDARFLEQGIPLHVLVAAAHRRRQRCAVVELAGGLVDRRDLEEGIRPDERLLDERSLGRGEELLLVDELHERAHEARARHLQRHLVDLQQIELRLNRHLERVLLDRRVPVVLECLHRRQTDRLGVHPLVGARDLERLPRDAGHFVLLHLAAGEAPRAIDDHAHAETVVFRVDDVLDAAVAREDELVAVAIDADVGA